MIGEVRLFLGKGRLIVRCVASTVQMARYVLAPARLHCRQSKQIQYPSLPAANTEPTTKETEKEEGSVAIANAVSTLLRLLSLGVMVSSTLTNQGRLGEGDQGGYTL